MVVGEPQILGQMKDSYALASEIKSIGPLLSRLVKHSFSGAKLLRSQTQVGAYPVSVAYAALQMAKRIFADLKGQTAVLIGAGEMIRLVAQHLQRHGVGRIVVANRSLERAEHLAREVHGYAISLNDLHTYLPDADLVIASTAAREFIVSGEQMERAVKSRRRQPGLMIDLAVPRDIDPKLAELEDIYLYTIDDLRNVLSVNMTSEERSGRTKCNQ